MGHKKVRKQQSFLHGAFILVSSAILVKVIGAVFKIPTANLIGEIGMGYFSSAYDLYLPIYALATTGLPIAISRIVAEHIAALRYKDVRQTLKVARRIFLIVGFVGFGIMLLIAYPFVQLTGNEGSLLGVLFIAPSLLFCCIMSSYRGYYEGLRNMYPTAISSLIEALGKLILGYGFAFFVMKTEWSDALSYEAQLTVYSRAAAAALLGITVGSALSALYLVIKYKRSGDRITPAELQNAPAPQSNKQALRTLVVIAIPICLGSLVNNIASLIDVTMVQRQLLHAVQRNPDAFWSAWGPYLGEISDNADIPTFLYGCYKSFAYPIFNLVPTLTATIGVSAIPVLAMAWTEKNKKAIKSNLEIMIKITALIAIPAGVGMIVMAKPIMNLLYVSRPNGAAVSAPILALLGGSAIFAGITFPIGNMLQAIGKERIPVINIAIGAVLKIIVNFALVGIPEVNILGAPIGTLVCYFYICVANFICLLRATRVVPNLYVSLVKPLLASVFCGAAAWSCYGLLSSLLNKMYATVAALAAAVFVYAVSLILLRAITREDVLSLPKGEKLARILQKLKVIDAE